MEFILFHRLSSKQPTTDKYNNCFPVPYCYVVHKIVIKKISNFYSEKNNHFKVHNSHNITNKKLFRLIK